MQPTPDRDRPARPARARALLCGLGTGALGLAVLTACTSGATTDNSLGSGGSTNGSTASTSAPPGKYQALPQPCDTVTNSTLKQLLPGAADYAGKAALTYDTDRRVGCTWSATGVGDDGGSRYLTIDLERVVSYDPAVSDESQAESDFEAKALTAGIPSADASPSSSGSSASASGSPAAQPSASTSPAANAAASSPGSGSGSGSGSAAAGSSDSASPGSSPAPGSRMLTGLGDDAYLDDVVATKDSGVHRDITVVFREANVLITVEYSQWSGDKTAVPGSAELQQDAQEVSKEIARQFD